jgi:hypothetical protein
MVSLKRACVREKGKAHGKHSNRCTQHHPPHRAAIHSNVCACIGHIDMAFVTKGAPCGTARPLHGFQCQCNMRKCTARVFQLSALASPPTHIQCKTHEAGSYIHDMPACTCWHVHRAKGVVLVISQCLTSSDSPLPTPHPHSLLCLGLCGEPALQVQLWVPEQAVLGL